MIYTGFRMSDFVFDPLEYVSNSMEPRRRSITLEGPAVIFDIYGIHEKDASRSHEDERIYLSPHRHLISAAEMYGFVEVIAEQQCGLYRDYGECVINYLEKKVNG